MTEEAPDGSTIELRNGVRLPLRSAVGCYMFLRSRQEHHPSKFAVLLAAYEGRQLPHGRDLVELQQAGVIKRDGSLDPEYRSVLDASIKEGHPTDSAIGPPYQPADADRWLAEEKRIKLNLLAFLRSADTDERPPRPR